MGGWKYIDYLQGKAKQRLRRSEASLQDFKDLARKKQIRREDKEAFQRKMDQVGDRRDRERADLQRVAHLTTDEALRAVNRHSED